MASTPDGPEQPLDRTEQVPSVAPSITPSVPRTQRSGIVAGQARRTGGRRSADNPHVDVARKPKHRRTSTEPRRRELLQALRIFQRATPDQLWKLTRPDNQHDKLVRDNLLDLEDHHLVRIEAVREDQRQVWVLTKRGHGEAKKLLEPKGHTGLGAARGEVRLGHREAARHQLRRPRGGGHLGGRRTPPRRHRPPARLPDRDRAPARGRVRAAGRLGGAGAGGWSAGDAAGDRPPLRGPCRCLRSMSPRQTRRKSVLAGVDIGWWCGYGFSRSPERQQGLADTNCRAAVCSCSSKYGAVVEFRSQGCRTVTELTTGPGGPR